VARFTAFYDANVLYPADLRNLLMHLALTGLFRATWSAGVHEEWISALLRNRPDLSREKLERTRMLMDEHAEDALVTGYEDLLSATCAVQTSVPVFASSATSTASPAA